MADNINTNDANEELERFTEYLKRFGGATVDTFEELGKLNKNTKEYDKAQKALWKNLNASIVNFNKSVKNGSAKFDDYIDQLEKLDDALEHATDAAQRENIQKNKDIIAEAARTKKLFDATEEVITKTTTTIKHGAGTFAKGLQNGSSATQLSADLLNGAIDIVSAGVTGTGQALSGAGLSAILAARKFTPLGAAASVAGEALQLFGEAGGALAKFGIGILSKEVEKTITAFDAMSASGAMFADGMTGMRNASAASGLTLAQFSNVVKNNTEQLAASGLGMTTAARMIGGVGKEFDKNGGILRKQLLKLGVGFEEQAELTAQVMSDMKAGQVGPLRANSKEIAEETAKYAENLRVISAVTGQDAKKKMDQVRQQATQLAFQQKLAGMSEKQRTDVLQAMGGMNTLQRKNYMDMMVFGHVINKEGAAAAALSGNLRQSTEEAYNLTLQGNFSLEKQLDINKRRNTGMQQDALGLHAVGMAHAAGVGGLAQALGEAFGLMLQEIKGQTPEAIAEAQAMAKQQKTSNDKLTTGVVNAAIAAQNLANDLEAVLTPAVGRYADATAKLLTVIEKAIRSAGMPVGDTTPGASTYDYTAMDYNKPSNAKYKANHDLLIQRQREAQDKYDRTVKGGDLPLIGSSDAWQKQIAERKRQLDAVNKNLRDYDESVRKVNPNNNPPAKTSDASARAPGNIKLVTIKTKSGLSFQVAEDKAPQFLGFIRDLEYKRGYDIKKITGYDARPGGVMDYNPKTGKYDIPSGRASHHSTGTAIDINPSTNPNLKNKIVTDMPSNITADAAKWGIGWGANWATQKDSMHFDANPASGGRDMAKDEVLQLLAAQAKELAKVNVNLAEGNRISKQIKENGR